LTSKFPSIASKLRNQGYRTGFIGKWHLGYSEESSANANGFDHYFDFNDWSIDYYSHKTFSGSSLYKNDSPIEAEGYITNVFTDNAIEFINEQPSKPFFLSLFYNAPLPPLQIPGNPEDTRDKTTWGNSTREDYIKVIENVDENIGRILNDLKEKGYMKIQLLFLLMIMEDGLCKSRRTIPWFCNPLGRRHSRSIDNTTST